MSGSNSSSHGENSASSSAPAHRSRNRGYSLRRSIFAQNIQKQTAGEGAVIELDDPTESEHDIKAKIHNTSKKDGKRETSFITETPVDEDERLPTNPVRLSNSVYDLPLYRRWLSEQSAHPRALHAFRTKLDNVRRFILRSNGTTLSSIGGRHVRINASSSGNLDERTGQAYIDNTIRSCRYTPLNFVPRQLWAQFRKMANFYFLCVSILQMIPGLSTTGTYTTIVPLLIFVSISMAKEGYDDIRRHRLDKEDNERNATILDDRLLASGSNNTGEGSESNLNSRGWRVEKWQDIKVGDVVLLQRDSQVPADIVLLHSDNPGGTAYIETKSLDGETNLKSKKALFEVGKHCGTAEAVRRFQAEFVVEDPNLDLYTFKGRVTIGDEVLPLTNSEIIYRGSILRNTPSAMGLVIYSGEECKIRMNATKNPRVKAPSMQFLVNKVVFIIAGLVLSLAIVMTSAYQVWKRDTEQHAWYLYNASVAFGPILTSFVIMFNTMLPLSLYVSLEIIKVCQMFGLKDVDMYDAESDTPAEARTSTLNEELGQVSYIFSDKTGTLTDNSMCFRKLSVAGHAWLHDPDLQEAATRENDHQKARQNQRAMKGKTLAPRINDGSLCMQPTHKSTFSKRIARGTPDVERSSLASTKRHPTLRSSRSLHCGKTDEMLEYIRRRPQTVFAERARFFVLSLALCHTCVPEKDDDGNIDFQASSPDELALVTAALDLGYIVVDRQSKAITVKTYPQGEDEPPVYEIYEILDVIEFSSLRKRMSIIVRLPDQRICVICKGADSTLRKLLRLSELATVHASAVERRASQRKSLEATEVLRRKSAHLSRNGSLSGDIGIGPISPIGRNSSVSLGRSQNVRDSIDHWLRERETDVKISEDSAQFYSPRPSGQTTSPGNPKSSRFSPRASFQTDPRDDLVDESVVINDSAVFERCFQHIDDFATEGLRTLLYTRRFVTETDYASWKETYSAASTSLIDRQEKIEKAAELIETQFDLVGATAIEDKLQEGVPDAIDRLRRAGIKLWMLTGDKRETAINIGHSCRLIRDYSTIVTLDHENGDLPARVAAAVADINNKSTAHSVLVIDGQTLALIETDSALKALFTDLAILADSVICCRASPSQKAGLVKTIRTKVRGSVTLAVGDGANDIAMIQEAHIGIGIAGKEGLQAARTSDYSIAQFRFLLKLLLVHGRWNYVRVCKYTLGTFWKEMMFYLVQALYQRWNGYTGTSLYEPWSLSMFNTLFTSLPVIFMGVFEKDLAVSTLLAVPELYAFGRLNHGFNVRLYFWWAFLATCDAVVIFVTMLYIYGEAQSARDNQLFGMGALAFTACVTLISLKMQVLELHNKSVTVAVCIFLSLGAWWLWNLLLSVLYPVKSPIYNVNHGLLDGFGKNPLWWFTLMAIVVAVSLFEITVRCVCTMLWPSDVDAFQAYEHDSLVRNRFEESAAELLREGWEYRRDQMERESEEVENERVREETAQAELEAHVQALLERPRDTVVSVGGENGVRRRQSTQSGDGEGAGFEVSDANANADQKNDGEKGTTAERRSVDVGELFRKGFGRVRKGEDLGGVKWNE